VLLVTARYLKLHSGPENSSWEPKHVLAMNSWFCQGRFPPSEDTGLQSADIFLSETKKKHNRVFKMTTRPLKLDLKLLWLTQKMNIIHSSHGSANATKYMAHEMQGWHMQLLCLVDREYLLNFTTSTVEVCTQCKEFELTSRKLITLLFAKKWHTFGL
jgi:hypothetical protein